MTRIVLLLMTLIAPAIVPAAEPSAEPEAPPPDFVLRPAAAPDPALKYRLIPDRLSLRPENAAGYYYRACLMLSQQRHAFATQANRPATPPAEDFDTKVYNWVTMPLRELPREEAKAALARGENPLREAELGAGCQDCDWQFDRRREGWGLLIPEIQEMRTLARLAALRARLAILDGSTDEAMHWIQVGFVMGRHTGQGPTIIQALVGIAMHGTMARCLEELIQSPGTPSLYWTLATRPRPMGEPDRVLRGELGLLERSLFDRVDLEGPAWSPAEARRFSEDLMSRMLQVFKDSGVSLNTPLMVMFRTAETRRAGLALMAARVYPEGRRSLLAHGRTAAEVDAMPVAQVAFLHTLREFQRQYEARVRWLRLPFWQGLEGLAKAEAESQNRPSDPIMTLYQLLSPAYSAYWVAEVRRERNLDTLQCIEAIRLHAQAHGGQLPRGLDELTDAPAPFDPATGRAFDYRVEGDTAILSAPIPPGFPNHSAFRIEYRLKLTH